MKLILNLNEPNRLGDVSWVKPGKYIGIWWGMHYGLAGIAWGTTVPYVVASTVIAFYSLKVAGLAGAPYLHNAVLLPVLSGLAYLPSLWVIRQYFEIQSYAMLLLCLILCCVSYLILVIPLFMTAAEKNGILRAGTGLRRGRS